MKKFSRILSILLILSMLLSLAPAVFAAETVTTEEVGVPSTHRVGVEDEEEVAIKIPTYVTLPANYSETANYPLVVLIHGHGGNHNEWGGYDTISNGLAAEDFVVVTLDFPGCGASKETFLLNTMTNMKNDVVDVLNYVTENYAVDETKVGAMGYSMGGRIVLELVAEELYDFATIELVAPGEDLENLKVFLSKNGTDSQDDKTYEEHKAEAEANGYTTFTSPYGAVQTLSKEFFADLEKYPDGLAEAAAEKYDGEALVIWSTDDWVIDPIVSETTANILGAVKLPVYANGHSYGFYGDDPYTIKLTNEGCTNWFVEELKNADEGLVAYVSNIQKYGHLDLNVTGTELLEHFAYGDIITAEINGKTFDLPVCTNYTDVDDGELLVRVVIDESAGKNTVTLAINYGKLAVESGVGYATTDANGNTVYRYNDDTAVPVVVKLSLKEAGGYYEDWLARQLPARTNVREDYADLSDEEFANFRNIATTGMGKDVLYRSSSPVNPEIGRNTYADAAAEAAGIKTFVNLADSEAGAAAYEGFADTYYSTQNVIYLNLAANFQAEDFKAGLAEGLRFMASNEGPYLFHCNEGKDRAGFTAAILECFMGATYDEVVADYMVTYYNYYGIEPGTEKYTAVANSNIVKSLVAAFGVEDLAAANLQEEAVEYLTEIGLTAEEQTALAENLSTSYGLAAEDEIVIYYTNDVHTYINKDLSYDNIADLKQQTAEQAAGVLLIDAGDHIQGTAYGSMDKGETIIKLMNAAGYDLATLGNHEFDYDMDRIIEIVNEEAQFPYVSANFYHEENGVAGDPVLDPYKIYTFGDTKIAIIGITTPESFTKSTPKYFQDDEGNYIYGIAGGEDGAELYAAVQKAIDEVKDEVDYVIALGHCGDDPSSAPWTSEEVIANTTGLDAFIDGHSHSTVVGKELTDKGGNTVLLTQTGEYFNAIGKMTISAEGIKTELIKDYNVSDAAVKAIKDEWLSAVDTMLGEKIAVSEVDFKIYGEEGRLIRKQETNLGDYCADALYYLFSETEGLKVDAAIMNGGGIRTDMPAGDISYKTTKTVHTFGNVACLITVTGQQILDALEWGAKNVGVGENGGFLQVSGITYEIHTYIASTVQADDKGVWIGGPTGEYRVKNVTIGGEPLDVNATYNLAGYNYTLRDLGDGFAMFDGAVNVKDYVMEDYLVLANYAKNFPAVDGVPTIKADNSVLGADYSDIYGEGRITIVTEGETVSFSDVEEGKWYYEWVMKAAEEGYIVGYEDGTFQPNKNVTRAEFAQMIYAASGSPELPEGVKSKFTDVTEGKWYYEPVTLLAAAGVIAGRTETTFDPNATITRQEMVAILYRLYKLGYGDDAVTPDLTVLEKFSDSANISAYAKEAFAWAIEVGVISGMGDGTLAPKGYTTRAQAAVVMVKCGEI